MSRQVGLFFGLFFSKKESGEAGRNTERLRSGAPIHILSYSCRRFAAVVSPPGGEVPWFHSLGKNILIRIVLQKNISVFLGGGGGWLKAGNKEARERSKMGRCYRGKNGARSKSA